MENTPPNEWPRVKSILAGALLFVVTALVVLRLLDFVLLPLLLLELISEGAEDVLRGRPFQWFLVAASAIVSLAVSRAYVRRRLRRLESGPSDGEGQATGFSPLTALLLSVVPFVGFACMIGFC